jgi:hypothetical protein
MASELAKVILNTIQAFHFVDEEKLLIAEVWRHLEDSKLQDCVGS